MRNDIFSQSPYRCRLDWGVVGAERAAKRGDIVVIVDVLSFSTSVAHAVSKGAVVFPCSENEDARVLANDLGAEIAVKRNQVPDDGRYSLSPLTWANVAEGTKVVLPSLNGGTCVRCSQSAAYVFAGALVNASAVGHAVTSIKESSDLAVTVIACGEREKEAPYDLRPAIEDYLGAGAVISNLPFDKSPEAKVCESAFMTNSNKIIELLWDSVSGRELRAAGFGDDVKFASRMNICDITPTLIGGVFSNISHLQM